LVDFLSNNLRAGRKYSNQCSFCDYIGFWAVSFTLIFNCSNHACARAIQAASEFNDKTTAINQMWQTDFTYLKIIGWGWMYLSTIRDDFSRYVVVWKLCTDMTSHDVTETLELALQASGCDQAEVVQKPRLLSDNGSSYVSNERAEWLSDNGMSHVRGAPYHSQT
jgi:putative transposase